MRAMMVLALEEEVMEPAVAEGAQAVEVVLHVVAVMDTAPTMGTRR
jgi:hypothetical protein